MDPNPRTGVLIHRGDANTEAHVQGGCRVKMRAEDGEPHLPAKESHTWPVITSRWDSGRNRSPHSPQKEPSPPTPRSWTSDLQNCDTIHLWSRARACGTREGRPSAHAGEGRLEQLPHGRA